MFRTPISAQVRTRERRSTRNGSATDQEAAIAAVAIDQPLFRSTPPARNQGHDLALSGASGGMTTLVDAAVRRRRSP
jgi:hypothetical protein